MNRPAIPADVDVAPGTDLEDAWLRFARYEALHHLMAICNPLSDAGLDEIVGLLIERSGPRWLDLACGHGELLRRAAALAPIDGVGVDLFPWVIARAARPHPGPGVVRWVIGDASGIEATGFDVACALGATWIWDDFAGTARALGARVRPGGTIVIGDLQRRPGVDANAAAALGSPLSQVEQQARLERLGCRDIIHVPTNAADWNDYQDRIAESAAAWAADNPGPESDAYVAEQERWRVEHDDLVHLVTWSVWIATT